MSIIGLQKANCKNCYKCIKVCPVKSIRLASEQAQIIEADCILCGKCLNTCPAERQKRFRAISTR